MNHSTLLQALARTPSADNSQPWSFTLGAQVLLCRIGARTGQACPFGPKDHATLLSGGAMHQSLAIALAPSDVAGTISVRECAAGWELSATVAADPRPESPAIRGLLARHTNRLSFRSDPVTWSPPDRYWPGNSQVRFINNRAVIAELAAATGSAPLPASILVNFTNGCFQASVGPTRRLHAATDWTPPHCTCRLEGGSLCDSSRLGREWSN
ncbi:MAG: hypothetical protein IPN24_16150 [Betaproteobacteria bacterium]|nr:hypothetical protein [Betaproteobacteria bacterium]